MAIKDIMGTGRSGMMSAKTAIATAGHNVTNANTKGFSRQRVEMATHVPRALGPGNYIGRGSYVAGINRVNDQYLEKQIRTVGREMAGAEEKGLHFKNIEDIFNELNGDGLNRLVAGFFNEFRQLANDPASGAVRQSVMETTNALVNDFKRIREELDSVRSHIDSRIEGYVSEVNSQARNIADLNIRIKQVTAAGGNPNDLLDQRDTALKNIEELIDVWPQRDKNDGISLIIRNVGPLVSGTEAETLSVARTQANEEEGKEANAYDVQFSGSATKTITHALEGGKLGALIQVRDKTLTELTNRLDQLAYSISNAVNQIHEKGVSRKNETGIKFFKEIQDVKGAAGAFQLSDTIRADANNIAAGVEANAPGDNRVAIAISGLQNLRLMKEGTVSFDDWYNSMVSEVGVNTARNQEFLAQQESIKSQLTNLRDQISGVSLDEETTNLMQFQHMYDASARMITIADEMLGTILKLRPL